MIGWQSHQLDNMQIICTSLQTDNYVSTSSLNLQARCSSWRSRTGSRHYKSFCLGELTKSGVSMVKEAKRHNNYSYTLNLQCYCYYHKLASDVNGAKQETIIQQRPDKWHQYCIKNTKYCQGDFKTRMWADAQRDGRPAKYR